MIRVVGVGGAGVNAINRMVDAGIPGVEFMAVNTDLQSLQQSNADVTVHLGSGMQRGLGAGSNPELGYRAAFEEQDKIKRLLKGSDMVFVTCGAGGGTGTGAAPVIARLARDVGSLTVGIVTKPFKFEGSRRASQAEEGVKALGSEVDTLIVVPNERLLTVLAKTTTMVEAFQVADDVLRQGVQGISELITLPGMINLDFADVRTTMRDAGQALLGIGMGSGDNRAVRGGRERRLIAAARDLGRRRPLDPAVDHRRRRAQPARGLRGGEDRPGGCAPGGQHHLRRQHRRVDRGRGLDHRDRDPLRRDRPPRRPPGAGRAPRARGELVGVAPGRAPPGVEPRVATARPRPRRPGIRSRSLIAKRTRASGRRRNVPLRWLNAA